MKEVASRTRVRAQALEYEVFSDSIMASLEKNPERKGMPVRANAPIVKQEVVMGIAFLRPPIFRISCSLLRLWIIDPAHRNSIALKKACVEMCRNASSGCLSPIVVIISPSWLEVENAIIFFISFWVRAQAAVSREVAAPRSRQAVVAVWLL